MPKEGFSKPWDLPVSVGEWHSGKFSFIYVLLTLRYARMCVGSEL